MPGGACLSYILERRAFTVPVVEEVTGLERNLIHSVVRLLMRGGVLDERCRIRGHGRPTSLYVMYDTSDDQIAEAAALYRDKNAEHVRRLDDYLIQSNQDTYRRVAEEAVEKHRDYKDRVDLRAVTKLLEIRELYGDDHLSKARQVIKSLGYTVIS